MPKVSTTLTFASETILAASATKKVYNTLSSVARTARLVDGAWIPALATQLPGVKQSLSFFGKSFEKPVAVISHAALSAYLKGEIKKQLKNATDSFTSNKTVGFLMSCAFSFLPDQLQNLALYTAPAVTVMNNHAMNQLEREMFQKLDPIINAPAAKLLGEGAGIIATESAKMYVGHKIQYMVIGYIADQLKDTRYTTFSTTMEYAKSADNYQVIGGIFTLMLAANLLPHLEKWFFSASGKDAIKTKLKNYVLAESQIDASSLSGKVFAMALDATIESLINSKTVNINQLEATLAGLEIAKTARNYYSR